jgi:hypothetical protein
MRRTVRFGVSVSVAVFAVATALAGTPLQNPPFSSGGFVPPDATTLKQESYVSRLLGKYAAYVGKCNASAVVKLQLAYEPENQMKVPDMQAWWTACIAKAGARYVYDRDRVITTYGTPPCLDQAGIDAIRAQIDALIPGLAPTIYCDDDAAAPDPVTGLNIPDFKIEAIGEVAMSKVVTKVGAAVAKCLDKAVGTTFKLGGALDDYTLQKIQLCLGAAAFKGSAAVDKLDQRQKLPACLPVATAQSVVSNAAGLGGIFTGDVYCASPSGAFVE